MRICVEFKRRIVDFVENQLTEQESTRFNEHLLSCKQCQAEYSKVKKLYEILKKDEVVLPEKEFFDNLRLAVRQKWLSRRRFAMRSFLRIFVPACAAAAVLLLLYRPNRTVEVAIPTSSLLDDEEIARLSLDSVIDEKLIQELSMVEEYLSFEIDEAIGELSADERTEFIENLYRKYGNGT